MVFRLKIGRSIIFDYRGRWVSLAGWYVNMTLLCTVFDVRRAVGNCIT
jgi:hypothetical protein